MQLLNICTKREYEKNGEIKTKWYKVGVFKIPDSGKRYIKLFQQPETEFFVFEDDEKSSAMEAGE